MSSSLGRALIGIIFAANGTAQIGGLATTADGRTVYFAATEDGLRQRGSNQSPGRKLFQLKDTILTLIEDAWTITKGFSSLNSGSGLDFVSYERPSVSLDGRVLAVWRQGHLNGTCKSCLGPGDFIRSPAKTRPLNGLVAISSNGRFAVYFKNLAPGLAWAPEWHFLDIETGQETQPAAQYIEYIYGIADDGTLLVSLMERGWKLSGPSGSGALSIAPHPGRFALARDASRVVYEVLDSTFQPAEIRVLDVATNIDRSFGPGFLPMLASDGTRFAYLVNDEGGKSQVWLGEALAGGKRRLTAEVEGIADQTLTGDGTAVIAATNTGRLLSIDTRSGSVTQLLDSPGSWQLLANPVPGSYNELVGTNDFDPQVTFNGVPPAILGRSPRGIAIQVAWETPTGCIGLCGVPEYAPPEVLGGAPDIVVRGREPAWERLLVPYPLLNVDGTVLPVVASSPDHPASYAIHQDWSGPVQESNPAHPGEVVHFFGTGWGPVDGAVPLGQPTPSGRLYGITPPCGWSSRGTPEFTATGFREYTEYTDAAFAGLAPGLVGVYQLDIRIPFDWKNPRFFAYCSSKQQAGYPSYTAEIDVQP